MAKTSYEKLLKNYQKLQITINQNKKDAVKTEQNSSKNREQNNLNSSKKVK
jgi:hypothetical protein